MRAFQATPLFEELTFFKRYLLQTDSNLVIWGYCLNDNHKFLHQLDPKGGMLATPEAAQSLAIHSSGMLS